MKNEFLVVTPTTGRSHYLEQTAASVRPLVEDIGCRYVMVCPPASIEPLRQKFPTVSVIQETAANLYAAINDGARCETPWNWLTYINDDDFFLPGVRDLCRKITSKMDSSIPTVVYSRAVFVKADGRRICEFPVVGDASQLLDYYRIACNPMATHGTFINYAAFERLHGFDASFRYAGDMDFFVRALQQQIRFVFIPVLSSAFRLHGTNLTTHREQFDKEERQVRSSIDGRLNGLVAKRLRLQFILGNVRSYAERLLTIRRLRVNDYLNEMSHGALTP